MSAIWRHVKANIIIALLCVCGTLFLAFIAAPYVSDCLSLSTEQIKIFRLCALGIFAWGVMGKSGWEIQSYKGETCPEKFNSLWFKALYLFGLFVGGLGLLVEPTDISS